MSMSRKRTWASRLLVGCCLLLFGGWAAGSEALAANDEAREQAARSLVQRYGEQVGGPETVETLVELNMRQWKPQSNRGIEVFGWSVQRLSSDEFRVSYGYQEMGREEVVLAWRVRLSPAHVEGLTPLSARILEMASHL